METWWGYEGEEGEDVWADGREVTKRVYKTMDAVENGYMRAGWDAVGDWLRVHPATHAPVRRVISVYGDREELQADAAVYARVLQAVRAVHARDGVTVEDVMGETEADRQRVGAIKYMVTMEEPVERGCGAAEGSEYSVAGVGGRGGATAVGGGGGVGGGRAAALTERWAAAMAEIRVEAAEWKLAVGGRLRDIVGVGMYERWRWGRVPMQGGKGWLVTYQHGGRGEFGVRADVEARVAVMKGQWGWAVYAVQECRAGQRLGWYDGDVVGADEWAAMGPGEGRDHTIRVGYTGAAEWVNGVDGVAGMQYCDSAYGREGREAATGRAEQVEKARFSLHAGQATLCVKKGAKMVPGEEVRVAYKWTRAAWEAVLAAGAGGGAGVVQRGWGVGTGGV